MDRTYRKFKKHTAILKATEKSIRECSFIEKTEKDPLMKAARLYYIVNMLATHINVIRSQPLMTKMQREEKEKFYEISNIELEVVKAKLAVFDLFED